MKIYLTKEANIFVSQIEEALEKLTIHDCNFAGMEWEFLQDDHLWIDDIDEIKGIIVLNLISRLIEKPFE